jgi:hypothetical protein
MMLSDLMDIVFYAGTMVVLITALVHLTGRSVVPSALRASKQPQTFYRMIGVVGLIVTAFLVIPQTRLWGLILGSLIASFSIVALLRHCRYAWSLTAILVLIALVPIIFAPA